LADFWGEVVWGTYCGFSAIVGVLKDSGDPEIPNLDIPLRGQEYVLGF